MQLIDNIFCLVDFKSFKLHVHSFLNFLFEFDVKTNSVAQGQKITASMTFNFTLF